ncbi:15483_t:CDS:1, partial [Funneliformis caledonium]
LHLEYYVANLNNRRFELVVSQYSKFLLCAQVGLVPDRLRDLRLSMP